MIDDVHLRDGLTLFENNERLGAFDAVLASVAIAVGADCLVSADRAFGSVGRLRHVVPDASGVASLLAG